MTVYDLPSLRPTEIEAAIAAEPILVLPFGTIEWHGPHLPVGLDGLLADDLGRAIAERCGALVLPASYWAVGGVPYPYTLTLAIDVIEPLLVAVFEQFGAMGLEVIVAFTGHFGLEQTLALKRAAVQVMDRSPVTVLPLTEYDLVAELYAGDHAGEGETSLLLATHPELVSLDAVHPSAPLDGVIGIDPRGTASRERGQELVREITSRGASLALWMAHEATVNERRQFREAVRAAVSVLEETQRQRATRPKSEVPPIASPTYVDHCIALSRRDFRSAQRLAQKKLSELLGSHPT